MYIGFRESDTRIVFSVCVRFPSLGIMSLSMGGVRMARKLLGRLIWQAWLFFAVVSVVLHPTELRAVDGDASLATIPANEARGGASPARTLVAPALPHLRNPIPLTSQSVWTNTLAVPFVRVPGTLVWFGVWDVRVRDYQAFVTASGRLWEKPQFEQDLNHPAVNVTWHDARAFCDWLTREERAAGWLATNQAYRLPTDAEWSVAAGLTEREGGWPMNKDCQVKGAYPWGSQWPPPRGAGNYKPVLGVDDFEHTSPVGSFAANRLGLYDLGGNVWQWCEDGYDGKQKERVLRGGSWLTDYPDYLLSSFRDEYPPGSSFGFIGFRCVLGEVKSP